MKMLYDTTTGLRMGKDCSFHACTWYYCSPSIYGNISSTSQTSSTCHSALWISSDLSAIYEALNIHFIENYWIWKVSHHLGQCELCDTSCAISPPTTCLKCTFPWFTLATHYYLCIHVSVVPEKAQWPLGLASHMIIWHCREHQGLVNTIYGKFACLVAPLHDIANL